MVVAVVVLALVVNNWRIELNDWRIERRNTRRVNSWHSNPHTS